MKQKFLISIILGIFIYFSFSVTPVVLSKNNSASVGALVSNQTINEGRKIRLRSLVQEHAVLAGLATINRFDDRPEFRASTQAIGQNTQAIADEVEKSFGQEKRVQFERLWRDHINLFIAYADATKANDATRRRQIVSQLQQFARETSSVLSRNERSRQQLRLHLQRHADLERAVIDAHARGDFTTQFQRMHEGFEHAGILADLITREASS